MSDTEFRSMKLSTSGKHPFMTIVVAATQNMGIGKSGGLPWILPGEMKYFAKVTTGNEGDGNTVIMGRKTWESIPAKFRPLKGRRNLIISRNPETIDIDGAANTSTHSSVESALSTLSKVSPRSKTFLIGGAQLYNQSLSASSLVNRILLTRVLDPPFDDCDTYLSNEFEQKGSGWERKGNDALSEFVGFHVADGEKEEKGVRYRFEMWERDLD